MHKYGAHGLEVVFIFRRKGGARKREEGGGGGAGSEGTAERELSLNRGDSSEYYKRRKGRWSDKGGEGGEKVRGETGGEGLLGPPGFPPGSLKKESWGTVGGE